jgi:hypothetical protein
MSRAKLAVFSVVTAALLGWQFAPVDNTVHASSEGIELCTDVTSSSAGANCWLVCPMGDGDRLDEVGATISVRVTTLGTTPVPGIPASDIWLEGCGLQLVLCGGSGAIDADSATNADGRTTLSGTLAASGCAPSGLVILVQGVLALDTLDNCNIDCLDIPTLSPDISVDGGVVDGIVELVDFAAFGTHFNTEGGVDADYDACCDYDCDNYVELVDFSIFGSHWQHSCSVGP